MAAQSLTRGTAPIILALAALLAGCQHARSISPKDAPAFEVSLASGRHAALAWHGGSLAHDAIYLQVLDQKGRLAGEPRQLTDDRQSAYEPALESFDDGWLLSWYEKQPADSSSTAWLERLDGTGKPRWRQTLSAAGTNGRNAVVRAAGQRIHVAWIQTAAGDSPAIWVAEYDPAGALISAPRAAAPASADTWNLNAAIDADGNFHVVYDAALGTQARELQWLRVTGNTINHRRLSADDGRDSLYPDIVAMNDRVALAWFDVRDGNEEIYLFAGPVTALSESAGLIGARITQTPGASIGAYLAWNGAQLGVAWCDPVDGQNEIFFASFDASGRPLGTTRRLTRTATQSSIPSVRPWGQGFAIAWNEYRLAEAGAGHDGIASSVAMLQIIE